MFKLWITIVILHLLLTVGVVFAEEHDVCKHEQKYTMLWYYNECDGEKLEIKSYQKSDNSKGKDTPWKNYKNGKGTASEIPWNANPNYEVLTKYLKKYIDNSKNTNNKIIIKKSKNYKEFTFNITEDKKVTKALNKTALLSYLMYVDGEIVIDQITPDDRFGKIFKNDSLYFSASMGKSIMSYVYGHAVCRGYVNGIHEPMNWDVLDNTLFENQPIINVLNMASGSHKIVDNKGGGSFKKSKRWANSWSINDLAKRELKNTKPGKNKYHYANLNTNVFASYVMATMGEKEYKKMLNDIFQNKIGIEYNVVMKQPSQSKKSDLSMTYGMHLTRYDFMRVAVAMLDDWNNNTCEGQYLKSLHENRIKKHLPNNYHANNTDAFSHAKSYGGQFHMGIHGKRNKPIFIMDGFGGQTITIDFENNKIVTTMAIHRNYNWSKLVRKPYF
tara:strand:+ start:1154 stop:2482 length:1329 start_codon:yes stop_codon:yes gene_type:complete